MLPKGSKVRGSVQLEPLESMSKKGPVSRGFLCFPVKSAVFVGSGSLQLHGDLGPATMWAEIDRPEDDIEGNGAPVTDWVLQWRLDPLDQDGPGLIWFNVMMKV